MSRNLGVDVTRLPAYPPDIRPRRVLCVIYFPRAPIKGFDALLKFFDGGESQKSPSTVHGSHSTVVLCHTTLSPDPRRGRLGPFRFLQSAIV